MTNLFTFKFLEQFEAMRFRNSAVNVSTAVPAESPIKACANYE